MRMFLISCLLAIGRSTSAQVADVNMLMFDGLYKTACRSEEGDDEGVEYYLRFYANGTVISVSTVCNGSMRKMRKWFRSNAEQVSKGTYQIDGANIVFSTTSQSGTVHYAGEIAGTVLKLKEKSDINGHEGSEEYEFIRLKGLK